MVDAALAVHFRRNVKYFCEDDLMMEDEEEEEEEEEEAAEQAED